MRARKVLVLPNDKENPKKEILDIIKRERLPFERIEAESLGDNVVVWVHTSWEKKLKNVLNRYKIKSFTSDVAIVELKNIPGELEKVIDLLSEHGIMIKDVHEIIRDKKKTIYGLITDRPKEAVKVIEESDFALGK